MRLRARTSRGRYRAVDGEAALVSWGAEAGAACAGRAMLCAYELEGLPDGAASGTPSDVGALLRPDVDALRHAGALRHAECDLLNLGDLRLAESSLYDADAWSLGALLWRFARSLRLAARGGDASRGVLRLAEGVEMDLPSYRYVPDEIT